MPGVQEGEGVRLRLNSGQPEPALRPQRATPRVEDTPPADPPAPLNRSMLAPKLMRVNPDLERLRCRRRKETRQ